MKAVVPVLCGSESDIERNSFSGRRCEMSVDHKALERAIAEITEIAKGFGLDFYPMRYGLPVRRRRQ